MDVKNQQIAVITGAASGIGTAVARDLAKRGAKAVALVNKTPGVVQIGEQIAKEFKDTDVQAFPGDVTDPEFRRCVYDTVCGRHGFVNVCVPAAGITRDALSVKISKETGEPEIYPLETFRLVTEVDLIAPIYWALEMVARVAKLRHHQGLKRWTPSEGIQGVVIFIGSVSSQGNKGQLAYATAKAGIEGAAATFMKEMMFHGVRCGVIHPGFTDTPMVRALGEEYIQKHILPDTQLGRLIQPEEIADAICFMISNAAVSGQLWADAGWHPSP